MTTVKCRLCQYVVAVLIVSATLLVSNCTSPTAPQLFHAIKSGDAQRVKQILAAAPQLVNVQDAQNGDTPLITAVRHCNPRIVQILLDRGADVHQNRSSLTALHVASLNGCHVVIPLLVKRGASVNERTLSGLTPLHLAGGCPACVATLLSLGADPLARTNDGALPIHFAASVQEPSSLKLLLQAGDGANARDADGFTPLMAAVTPAVWLPTAKECVMLLLKHGARADVYDKRGQTALHYLARFPLKFVKQTGGGAFFDLQQQERLHIEIARELIAAGCDPLRKDVDGLTAGDIALQQGSIRLANFLRGYRKKP